jgi:RND family efflux transporter MFP subunit
MRLRYAIVLLAGLLAVALVAVGPQARLDLLQKVTGSSGGGDAKGATPPMPELSVGRPVTRKTIEWDEYIGRFDAVESVDVRARVSGYLTAVNFTDGQDVKAGDLLFEIDARPFERALDQAKAQLNEATVRVSNASLDVERGRPLLKSDYISKKVFDDRENIFREAEAAVKVAEARVKAAELELSFCRVTAPISGRVSRTFVTKGNFVSGGSTDSGATILTTIVTQDPIYIYFDISENNALKYARFNQAHGKGEEGMIGAAVQVRLPDEKGFAHSGKLDFLDNRLDQGTGTLRARAVVPNTTGLFSPGMFGHVRLQGSPEYEGLLVPDEAIVADQTNRFVYVVGPDDIPVRRTVQLGPLVDGLRVVRSGLSGDDWIVLRGQQRVRPDKKIIPKRVPIEVSDAEHGGTGALTKP